MLWWCISGLTWGTPGFESHGGYFFELFRKCRKLFSELIPAHWYYFCWKKWIRLSGSGNYPNTPNFMAGIHRYLRIFVICCVTQDTKSHSGKPGIPKFSYFG